MMDILNITNFSLETEYVTVETCKKYSAYLIRENITLRIIIGLLAFVLFLFYLKYMRK